MAALIRLLASFMLVVAAAVPVAAADKAIIVLDASGSMWGQVDGKPKLQIARDTLRSVLGKLPTGMELGLMAYGHREKGSCEDIELLVPPAAGTGASIAAAADSLSFVGKTPLTAAVRRAAEQLDYTRSKATVILVTDGLESCEADPCAVAKELKDRGSGLTVHVVGFGLTEGQGRQVACLADNTGGKYIQASDAAGLTEALTETVAAAEPPAATEAEIGFTVVDQEGKRVAEPLAFSITAKAGGAPTVLQGTGEAKAMLKSGDYQVAVSGPDIAGGAEFSVASPPVAATVEIAVEISRVETSLEAPDTAPVASTITIGWVGPGKRYDEIQLFNPRGPNAGEVLQRQGIVSDKLFADKKVSLVMPARPGRYELRYNDSEAGKILATRPIEIVAADVSLAAPDSVAIGSGFTVAWIGPAGRYDDVEIFDPAARGGTGEVLKRQSIVSDRDFAGRKVTMTAPAKAGEYRLRYWNGDNGTVLFEKPIKVTDVKVSLDAPASVPLSGTFAVKWVGPAARYDDIQIFDPAAKGGEGEVMRSARIVEDDAFEQKTVSLVAPAKPGRYELRYWNGDDNRALATRAIEVTGLTVSLDAPQTVDAGGMFKVKWAGPAARYDDIQIYRRGDGGAEGEMMRASRIVQDEGFEQKTVELVAPSRDGTYELRYWSGEDNEVLATRPLAVVAISVSIDAPASVDMGATFVASWQGPGARYDDIQIGPPGSDSTLFSARIPQDDKFEEHRVSLVAPVKPGTYDLRYWNGEDSRVLATRKLEVKEVPVVLVAPAKVKAGETFSVDWQGPGARYDDVQMVRKGADSAAAYVTISQDTGFADRKASLTAPAEKGEYELRYWNGDFGAVLATKPIVVE